VLDAGYTIRFYLQCRWNLSSLDIIRRRLREGRLSLEEAKRLIKEKDPKLDQKAMIDFIDFLGYTQKEFWEITDKLWNKDIFEQTDDGWVLKDPPY
jgi:hypothetical protein